jgi:Flp pilus assembly pilin Flp
MSGIVASFVRDQRGAIQVEYAIMAALIGAAIGLGLSALGDAMVGQYQPIVHASGGAQTHSLPTAVGR